MQQTEHFLRYRRSIRNYKSKAVEKEKVTELSSHVIDWMKSLLKSQPDMAKMMHMDMITAAWEMGMDVVSRRAPALVLVNGGSKDPLKIIDGVNL
ncbi:MAG: hypothetical protein HOG03_11285 [Desulfobacula sp.]|jgi:hypothetical protein|uniref:hypothetical protein n=1 Tax=Desulfobacula sp. TaxID=2593537 RepID=UPI001D2E1729|nr:hypothetical protein [Desulfobacula sp.]MBT3485940.1 hypothetical protein [Desulfobacula sp.]MBT3805166.1 hypothetical protein [Desulfobacula sp.]MBT4025529.1 hypothetical protein [Desulfobacula sp.]MBT4198928.1 hypothetical protein [Desulfobacula sp.]